MGFFQHGSTIILFSPRGYQLCGNLTEGTYIKMGEALLRRLKTFPGIRVLAGNPTGGGQCSAVHTGSALSKPGQLARVRFTQFVSVR
jgi:hypothetical protein